MRLINLFTIKGQILLESGLHIGAGNDNVEIGGLDNPVIVNPLTRAPYIPGSSLKGKMRSLMETARGWRDGDKGEPCACAKKDCPICVLFGPHKAADKTECGPTRLLTRDSLLAKEFMDLFLAGELPMEIKYENSINRLKGVAENPRQLERVPAGVKFNLNLGLRVYEGDDAEALVREVKRGLKLVQTDALGGCSSRGGGKVAFLDLTLNGKPFNLDDVEIFADAR